MEYRVTTLPPPWRSLRLL